MLWANAAGRLFDAKNFFFPTQVTRWPWAVFGDWVICASFACLVLALLLARSLARVFEVGPLRFMWRISYCVYLWHWPLITYLLTSDSLVQVLLIWGLVLAIGTASYYLIERPFLRSGKPASTPSAMSWWTAVRS